MLEKFDETCSDTMLRLSALDVIKLDMLHKNNMLPHALYMVIIITITMTTFIFLETRVYWLCVRIVGKAAGRWDRCLATRMVSLLLSFSPFASGSNLVVLIIKASAGCCCRVRKEVKCAL